MFERFTERGRQVIVHAQDEARTLGHGYVGTEHLLLGLLHDRDALAARALASFGVTLDEVRGQVAGIVAGGAPITHQIPFTPQARAVLDRALQEALELNDQALSTEHILLGLLHESDGVAVGILVRLGAIPNAVRTETLRLARHPATPPARSNGSGHATLLRVGCPRCGGELHAHGLEPDRGHLEVANDLRTACPSCGAAWVLSYRATWDEDTTVK